MFHKRMQFTSQIINKNLFLFHCDVAMFNFQSYFSKKITGLKSSLGFISAILKTVHDINIIELERTCVVLMIVGLFKVLNRNLFDVERKIFL